MNVKAKVIDWFERAKAFLKDVRVELTKVTWPTWQELKGQTMVVLIAVLIISAFIGIVDRILSGLYGLLVRALS
jgi:preprotein translocase subunit SecE